MPYIFTEKSHVTYLYFLYLKHFGITEANVHLDVTSLCRFFLISAHVQISAQLHLFLNKPCINSHCQASILALYLSKKNKKNTSNISILFILKLFCNNTSKCNMFQSAHSYKQSVYKRALSSQHIDTVQQLCHKTILNGAFRLKIFCKCHNYINTFNYQHPSFGPAYFNIYVLKYALIRTKIC